MQNKNQKFSAQIGVTAVLLTIVLLGIGVSVTTRIVRQVGEETARTESTQAFNRAESNATTQDNLSGVQGSGNIKTQSFSQTNPTGGDHIYLQAGQTAEAPASAVNGKTIYWEYSDSADNNKCDPKASQKAPALLIIHDSSKSGKSIAYYYPIRPWYCENTSNYSGYEKGGKGSSGYQNAYKINLTDTTGIVRVKALYANTYVQLQGLVSRTRSAASNEGGNEVRVVEQTQTEPAAPHIFDYSIFVANGNISQ
ncbi:hypothetical protein IJJ27_02260 [bacterium]|nr:hypothetical protein [bacterium]MBQ6436365.1 hypothetical protein [bacterium]